MSSSPPAAAAAGASPPLKRKSTDSGDEVEDNHPTVVSVDLTEEERESEAGRFVDALVLLVESFPVRCVDPEAVARLLRKRLSPVEDAALKKSNNPEAYHRLTSLFDRLQEELCWLSDSLPAAMATHDTISLLRETERCKKKEQQHDAEDCVRY
jgi:hypothetical protein